MRSSEGGGSRPSSGVWSLLSRLRSSRASSSGSSTSSGSVRSARSFAYLPPGEWPAPAPLQRTPPPSPSPSYRRRVSSSRRRASFERNLTLQTKYRLPIVHRGLTYDSFSLPAAGRRAHVPGKRPAPPPPRARPAKRPAPPPPTRNTTHNRTDENAPLNRNHPTPQIITDNKPTNGDSQKKTDVAPVTLRPNRSFLKQIFDNKKRSSAIVVSTPPIKLLPNISELDRQAAEILKAYKIESATRKSDDRNQTAIMLKGNSSYDQEEVWLCTRCLKKYSPVTKLCSCSTVATKPSNSRFSCEIHVQAGSSSRVQNDAEDKEKLREMLIEMKHSLPKDPQRHAMAKNNCNKSSNDSYSSIGEAATLRIGTTIEDCPNQSSQLNNVDVKGFTSQYTKNSNNNKATTCNVSEITRTANELKTILDSISTKFEKELEKKNSERKSVASSNPYIRNKEPLKISTLLNPIYVPKNDSVKIEERKDIPAATTVTQPSCSTVMASTSSTNTNILTQLPQSSKATSLNQNTNSNKKSETQPKVKSVTQLNMKLATQTNIVTQTNVKSETQSILKTVPAPAATRKSEASSQTNALKITPSTSKPKQADSTNLRSAVNESIVKLSSRRDLINKLERSIATGDEHAAAEAATKLAQLKLSCAVLSFSSQIAQNTPSTSFSNNSEEQVLNSKNITNNKDVQIHINTNKGSNFTTAQTNDYNKKINVRKAAQVTEENKKLTKTEVPDKILQIEVWIEDKSAARGPVRLSIRSRATLGALRQRAADTLGVAIPLQRWVVQHKLCTDDTTLLTDLAGQNLDVPFYLCLVESDQNQGSSSNQTAKLVTVTNSEEKSDKQSTETNDIYNELMQLERNALVQNTEPFECPVCMEQCKELEGVVLRQCVHMFCRECLSLAIRHCVEPEVLCPAQDCTETLQEREVRALVSQEEYERWLARGLTTAESRSRHAFHCCTSDCKGWAFCEPGVQQFNCPVCRHVNCVSCKAIHEGSTCSEHKTRLTIAVNPTDNGEDGTKALLDTLIAKGEALKCPECNAIIVKKWGCDWVRCSACKTEICWVTKGPRWGPAGRGDTSAGCRCGVDGIKCHPSCSYCH